MQKHRELTLRRLELFANTHLRNKLYTVTEPVKLAVYSAPRRISYAEAMAGQYRPAQVGEHFTPPWSTHWFRVTVTVPVAWEGTEVHFLFDGGCEACVWIDGQPRQGLTGSILGQAATRPEYILTRHATGGETFDFYVEMAVNTLFGVSRGDGTKLTALLGTLSQAEIAVFDREAWALLWDATIITEMARTLPPETPRGGQALAVANRMVNVCDPDRPETWDEARDLAREFLSARNGDGQHNLSAIGHAHIDSAWLWPVAETKRKCYRTFATALRNMEEYPDYKFVVSQAVQWEWMKEMHPPLYKQMLARAREGRFIPAGGTWIEPDCNIPSGEALVRQFLIGQRYFEQELGVRCGEFWNPDVFGYSAQLPQIMRGAGIEYFLTQKLSWNQFNKLPSHTFQWEGLDGSRVLTHFPPADTYNAVANVKELVFNVSNYKDHERGRESYMLYGFGDGGGGPTREMLERLERCKDVDGLPRVEQRAPAEFFERLERDIEDPTVWVGELYFELHRGTYTTQAKNKLWNRRCEFLLHDVELLGAVAAAQGLAPYPAAALLPLWKSLLFNQFHDIIPGSSITEVYQDSAWDYQALKTNGQALRGTATTALFGAATTVDTARVRAINTLDTARREVVELPAGVSGVQTSAKGYGIGVIEAPAMGATTQVVAGATADDGATTIVETSHGWDLENAFVAVQLYRDGRVAAIRDKVNARDVLSAPGNNFVLFDDNPNQWDAWDVDVFHLEKRWDLGAAESIRVIEDGPLRVAVELVFAVGKASKLTQVMTLTALSPRLDFECTVDWHEQHRFLKVEFPVNVRCFHASYEVQFGYVQRPTHFNSSWDVARFEVCGQRWADLSEPDYGVALMNDCKYGYAVQGNVMRLSLLRGTTAPDPVADQGTQHFRFALYPHAGNLQQGGVVREALRFNAPMMLAATDAPASQVSWFQVDSDAVILDTVKQAEDSDAIVVRLYEAHGTRGFVTLRSALPIVGARRCNLLEDDSDVLDWQDGAVCIAVKPFEIISLKLAVAKA